MPSDFDPAEFIDALHVAESTRDIAPIGRCFADDATMLTVASHVALKGRAAVELFWKTYLELFQSIRTTFMEVRRVEGLTVMEWRSIGTLAGGTPIDYRGVTLLEGAGGVIRSFRSYYDSAAFIPDFKIHLKRK